MAEIYKVLGQAAPGATTDTNLYTVPAGAQTVASTIIVANRSESAAAFRIAIRPAGATLANQHYIAFDVAIAALDSTTLTLGITLSSSDVITVRATSANLSFSAFGTEVTS